MLTSNTATVAVKSSPYIRWYGAAAILGGVLLVLATTIYAFTHGTQSQAEFRTLFGLSSLQYSRIFQPVTWSSFLLAVIAVNVVQAGRAKRLGQIGFVTSALGYGLAVLSVILQVWIVDPNQHFDSVFVQGGFGLWLLSLLIQSIGMTLFGLALLRAKALPRWKVLPLLIGLLLLPLLLFQLFIFETSDNSLLWRLIYSAAPLPYSLCWILLGYSLWSQKPVA